MVETKLAQWQSQSQVQVLSQVQIQSLNILSMSGTDLREAVYNEVQDNPALIITKDKRGGDVHTSRRYDSSIRVSSSSSAGEMDSDRHQAALEAHADTRRPLQDYLLSQLHVMNLSREEMELGERLIGNLDSRGFHILAPVSLLDKNSTVTGESDLNKMIGLIQQFDPPGCCCKNTEESLLVQARQRADAPKFALFLLDGHFDFLNPPTVSSIVRKSKGFLDVQSKLFGVDADSEWKRMTVDPVAAENALAFIRSLEPYPARDFSSSGTNYVEPDVYVERIDDEEAEKLTEDFSKGIVVQNGVVWQVRLASSGIPSVAINPAYSNYTGEDQGAVIRGGMKRARDFISALEGRQNTLLRGVCMLVKRQHEFFSLGPGHLVSLKQKDIAAVLEVHETTVSRMVLSKYIQCSWGLFAMKYFFVNSVGANADGSVEGSSRDKVKAEIAKILKEHEEKLSDQKISDMLAERGIKVARRTVAKYRSEM
ncbi:MAG: RNA polymerase factor sigma-54 [Treponema sp.]|nr:RNA polymerase factor sigma-54 [Treponema sp.]